MSGAIWAGAAAALLLAACAHAPKPIASPPPAPVSAAAPVPTMEGPAVCPNGLSPATVAQLMFGLGMSDGAVVSDADWTQFQRAEITPRFPEGLSVIDMKGQWRASTGEITTEPAKQVLLVLDGGPDDSAKLENIRTAYKARFHQDSVLLIIRRDCVSF